MVNARNTFIMVNSGYVLTVFAGTNGAGKSTISKQMKSIVGTIIDPDAIAKSLNPSNPRNADLSAGKEAVVAKKSSSVTVYFAIVKSFL
jgi:predicted ABC-type ATPase